MKLRRVAALFRSSQSSQTWNGFQHVASPVLCCPLGEPHQRPLGNPGGCLVLLRAAKSSRYLFGSTGIWARCNSWRLAGSQKTRSDLCRPFNTITKV
ncbi:hypothetical protein CDEST_00621 [Colletotrichum destructivum]|uniref:Uncharacterized protein n=1 Tax=Colletotrichum destructivum TaxID=34406 RepID=A0AAX4HX28_9PEZI|nr:hypothetical protein CDEST_00621 [Colletotrichum destructivum]